MSTVSTLIFHKIRRTCIQKHSWEITQNMQPGKDLPFSWKNRCLSSSIRLASNSFCQKREKPVVFINHEIKTKCKMHELQDLPPLPSLSHGFHRFLSEEIRLVREFLGLYSSPIYSGRERWREIRVQLTCLILTGRFYHKTVYKMHFWWDLQLRRSFP